MTKFTFLLFAITLTSTLAKTLNNNNAFVPLIRNVRDDEIATVAPTEKATEKSSDVTTVETSEGDLLPALNMDLNMDSFNDVADQINFGSFCRFLLYSGIVSFVCVLLMNLNVCEKIPHCKKSPPKTET